MLMLLQEASQQQSLDYIYAETKLKNRPKPFTDQRVLGICFTILLRIKTISTQFQDLPSFKD